MGVSLNRIKHGISNPDLRVRVLLPLPFWRMCMYRLQGAVGVLSAKLDFIEKGYELCEPVCDAYGYDLLVYIDSGYKKIQVKTSTYSPANNESLCFGLHRTAHNNSKIVAEKYKHNEVDYFYLYFLLKLAIRWVGLSLEVILVDADEDI